MTKFSFDQHVTLAAEQPLTVLLFDLCSPGQELLFVQDDSGGLLVNGWNNSRLRRNTVALCPIPSSPALDTGDLQDHDVQRSNVRKHTRLTGVPFPHYQ